MLRMDDRVRVLKLSSTSPRPQPIHQQRYQPFGPLVPVGRLRRAIDAGLSADDAIRAFTLSTAEIFGVADRLGSIEKGKIANLVVTKGNLFETNTKIQYVVIDGVKFQPTPEPPPPPAEETN